MLVLQTIKYVPPLAPSTLNTPWELGETFQFLPCLFRSHSNTLASSLENDRTILEHVWLDIFASTYSILVARLWMILFCCFPNCRTWSVAFNFHFSSNNSCIKTLFDKSWLSLKLVNSRETINAKVLLTNPNCTTLIKTLGFASTLLQWPYYWGISNHKWSTNGASSILLWSIPP
jgi:hypothetical protein